MSIDYSWEFDLSDVDLDSNASVAEISKAVDAENSAITKSGNLSASLVSNIILLVQTKNDSDSTWEVSEAVTADDFDEEDLGESVVNTQQTSASQSTVWVEVCSSIQNFSLSSLPISALSALCALSPLPSVPFI